MSYHVVRRRRGPQRRHARAGRRPGGEARGRPQAAAGGRGHRRRRDPGDGPPRPHAPVGARHGRVQGAGPRARRRAGAASTTPRRSPHAGCFAIVLEGVPDEVARLVTDAARRARRSASAPGAHCDGQVLVFHDVLGIEDRMAPKFVRRYADLGDAAVEGLQAFADDVRARPLPERRRELPPVGRGGRGARPVRRPGPGLTSAAIPRRARPRRGTPRRCQDERVTSVIPGPARADRRPRRRRAPVLAAACAVALLVAGVRRRRRHRRRCGGRRADGAPATARARRRRCRSTTGRGVGRGAGGHRRRAWTSRPVRPTAPACPTSSEAAASITAADGTVTGCCLLVAATDEQRQRASWR